MTDDEGRTRSWDQIRSEMQLDEREVAAYERVMVAEERLCKLWEQRGEGMNWVGELVGSPVESNAVLWLAELGERVAALGGHLEVAAVFPDETITLLLEPGPQYAPDASG